jgi:hypothetical protein
MNELLNLIFNGANAIPTGLLLFIFLYWIIVIIGLVDTEFLDFDLDIDGEPEFEIEGGVSGDVSWLNNVLSFFNLGRIPFMIWLSFVSLPLWLLCVNINNFLGIESFIFGLFSLIPLLFLSLLISKVLTTPFARFFEKINEDSKKKEIIGKIGTVISSASHESKGMAELNYQGSFLRLYIRSPESQSVLKGDQVLFIEKLAEPGVYLVERHLSIS